MTVSMIRKELKLILEKADDEQIKALYRLWGDIAVAIEEAEFSDLQLSVLEQRRSDINAGKSLVTDWEKMHENIRTKRTA